MDETIVQVKKKRKYQKRGTHKITANGKSYVGSDITREGKFLVLKTDKGCVMVNLETASTAVEVVGAIRSASPFQSPATAPSNGGPVMAGGIAGFKAARDRILEESASMPGFEEA